MDDIRLSASFALSEFTASQAATRWGIYNIPTGPEIDELRRVARVLDQVRSLPGIQRPIFVSSGYRCVALNDAVGGARSSAHVAGRAADITIPGLSALRVCQIIAPHVQALGIDQLIYEGTWTHIGLVAADQPHRAHVLTATFSGGPASYSFGLPEGWIPKDQGGQA